jgi:hypothetical protein
LAVPAPRRPPIRACELEEGIPPHHVMRFQVWLGLKPLMKEFVR